MFIKKNFCLVYGLKLALKKLHSGLRQSHEFRGNEMMHIVFTTEDFLEAAKLGYYLNFLGIYKSFTMKKPFDFVISCDLVLLSSIVTWIFF